MTTTNIDLTDGAWVDTGITDTDADWILQNVGKNTVHVMFSDTQPAEGEVGHLIFFNMGMTSATFGTGKIWVRTTPPRTFNNNETPWSTVAVTK